MAAGAPESRFGKSAGVPTSQDPWTVLLRFIVLLILNFWVTLVILKYRKKKDQKDAKKKD